MSRFTITFIDDDDDDNVGSGRDDSNNSDDYHKYEYHNYLDDNDDDDDDDDDDDANVNLMYNISHKWDLHRGRKICGACVIDPLSQVLL